MTRYLLRLAALLLVVPLLAGCDDDSLGQTNDGDCAGRIGWDGVVYRPHSELNQAAPRGPRLGSGEVLDCDGSSVESVEVFAIAGVESSLAIKVVGEWRGVYVAEDGPKSSWPRVLKTR